MVRNRRGRKSQNEREPYTGWDNVWRSERNWLCRYSLYFVTFTLGKCFFTVNKCISCIWPWIAFSFKLTYLCLEFIPQLGLDNFRCKKKSKHEKWHINEPERWFIKLERLFFLQYRYALLFLSHVENIFVFKL